MGIGTDVDSCTGIGADIDIGTDIDIDIDIGIGIEVDVDLRGARRVAGRGSCGDAGAGRLRRRAGAGHAVVATSGPAAG
jgi:hypothetical protein